VPTVISWTESRLPVTKKKMSEAIKKVCASKKIQSIAQAIISTTQKSFRMPKAMVFAANTMLYDFEKIFSMIIKIISTNVKIFLITIKIFWMNNKIILIAEKILLMIEKIL
jgi:hypothetical protein